MKLSEKLRLLREEKGKTQEEVANELGFGIQTLRNYESDKIERIPNTAQLKDLKKYYDVTYEYLLDDECENKTPKTVEIGKELGLSDKSINKIKKIINFAGLGQYMNIFIENIDLQHISFKINEIIDYMDIYYFLENIIEINLLNIDLVNKYIKEKKYDLIKDGITSYIKIFKEFEKDKSNSSMLYHFNESAFTAKDFNFVYIYQTFEKIYDYCKNGNYENILYKWCELEDLIYEYQTINFEKINFYRFEISESISNSIKELKIKRTYYIETDK